MIKKKWDMFAESVSMSLSNIAGNKMTTLGIIIGVGAIIALMTVVQGATDTMNAQFDAMGLGTLRVSVAGTAIKHGLTDDDLQTILDCEHVAGISPSLNATVTAKRGNVWSDSISVNGNNDEYFRHNPDLLRRGRAIDVLDVENNARVCLVDGDAAKTLFFGEDPVGQTFYLDGFEYTVVGMIDAFDAIQAAGDISPTLVAGGIKVALLTTLMGLIAAVILQLFYNYIVSKIDSLVNEMEDTSITLTDILTAYNKK